MDMLSKITDLMNRRKFKKVINLSEEYLKSINSLEKKIFLYTIISSCYFNLKQYTKSIFYSKKIIELSPDYITYYNMGVSYFYLKEYNEAINYFNRITQVKEFKDIVYYSIGTVYLHLMDYNRAISSFNKALSYNSNSYIFYYNRALAYMNIDDYGKAIEDLNKAIDIKLININIKNEYSNLKYYNNMFIINEVQIYNSLGISYGYLKEYDKAIDNFNKALSIDNNYYRSYYDRGVIYLKIKNLELAEKDFDKVISLYKYHFLSYTGKGIINNYRGEYDKAIENFKESIRLKSEFDVPYHNLLTSYIKAKMYNECLDVIDSALSNLKYPRTYILISAFLAINNSTIKNRELFYKLINHLQYEFKFLNEKIEIKRLFNYTKINKDTIYSILNNTIWLSHTKAFNDPVDPYIKIEKYFDEILNKIKVACLTTKNDNTLMWSHYADKHQGICIEYDITSIFNKKNYILKKVNYNSQLKNDSIINYTNTVDSNNNILHNVVFDEDRSISYIVDAFTIKSKEWVYEDEYRILYYDESNSNNGLLLNLPIKSICFGVNTSESDKKLVCNIINMINKRNRKSNYKKIKVYQAKFDKEKLFSINIFPYSQKKYYNREP